MLPFYEYRTDLLRVEEGEGLSFPPHLHVSLELLYVRSGTMRTFIGEKEYNVCAGDIAFIFPNTVHAYEYAQNGVRAEFLMLIYNDTLSKSLQTLLHEALPQTPVISKDKIHPDIVYALHALKAEQENDRQEEVITLLIKLIMARATSLLSLSYIEDTRAGLTGEVIEYIVRHYREPLCLEDLSHKFGVSRYRVSRIFSNVIKTSFHEYVNMLRIGYAQKCLTETDLPILQIAFDSGFENQQSFNRVFKQKTGLTPLAYRKKQKQERMNCDESLLNG